MELASLNDPQSPNLQNASSYTAQIFTKLNQSCFFSIYWCDLGCCSFLSKLVAVSTVNLIDPSLLKALLLLLMLCSEAGEHRRSVCPDTQTCMLRASHRMVLHFNNRTELSCHPLLMTFCKVILQLAD